MLFAPGSNVSNVQIKKYVGAGAFGEVYHAVDLVMDRECAVKYVENKDPVAFKAHVEGQILHICKHEYVVEVFDVQPVSHAGKMFAAIEMEYMPDGSAESYLENNHVSVKKAIRWLIHVLFALENAHHHSVLHRDIKPANFMLSGGKAKLSDFGLAKVSGGVPHGSAKGTPVYAAPELFSGGKTTIQTDIFSSGISLFQLASNVNDWDAHSLSTSDLKKGKVINRCGFPGYVPQRLRRVCNKACHYDSTKRYGSAREMRQALEALSVKLDWVQSKPNDWTAEVGGNLHRLTIAPTKGRYEAVYQLNGRRKNKNCKTFSTMAAAIGFMHDTIADTTLR
ncbi:serine/threonine protein kinase [Mesorhizobium sp. B2-5-9]|uniref:serine/threonine-protein kinase n=1 Tax=unclassified Mesorhizobium TaxID=325217 RepID=UPI00112C94A3|nr:MULTISPECIES: serine/threonine-protein kinase [unclassified Mesorhizobium]TPK23416.1 serine/threonine protein kinase [Mesorhizobium sp. B2-5-9]TPK83846.1 serine/threonine protein kinase [Mesorhizobium sp. B2-4-13]